MGYTETIRNLFPEAKEITSGGNRMLVLPHRPVETYLLRKHGYEVPAPILSHYDWPGMETPFDVQKKTAALLVMNARAYVLNDMGTGKTSSALWAWDYLNSQGLAGKLLVIAPLSTLKFTWGREIMKALPHRKFEVLHGTRKQRSDRLSNMDADIYIINHDGIATIRDELVTRKDINSCVLDELSAYRNGGSDRTKAMRKLSSHFLWLWGMTGSPIPNSPTDAWAEASIITPHTVPKYFTHFRDQLLTKVALFKWVPKEDAVERAYAALQPAVRFTLDDVVELPEVVERWLDVPLGPSQTKIYKSLADKCHAAVNSQEITAANAGAVMSKLLQVSTGWVYTSDGNTVGLDNGDRISALTDAIMSANRKVLVFVPFKHALAGISAALTKEGIDHACVSGDTSLSERNQIFTAFQTTNKYKVIAAHPQCLAHGITLTAADTIIWFAPVTSLEIYEQANRRIRRIGQTHKQLLLHLQSTPVERRIYTLLRNKHNVQSALLQLFQEATASEGDY